MAQIHSYYITNAKSELKFSSINLNEDEIEVAMKEITTAMINNDDLFEEDDDDIISDSENINIDEEDTDNLHMTSIINLDIPEFEDSSDSGEKSTDDVISDSIQLQSNSEDFSNVNFEAILAEEFD